MMATVLETLDAKSVERLLHDLGVMKDNLRAAIARNGSQQQAAQVQTAIG
jgi:hypothetical protein